jgi:putative ABC transport system permease protein
MFEPGTPKQHMVAVVGVVENFGREIQGEPAKAEMFVPFAQHPNDRMAVVARFSGSQQQAMADVRAILRATDAGVPVFDLMTVPEIIQRWLRDDRLFAGFMLTLAILITFLAGIGLYGMMSYAVSQRTREIGLRIALGAYSSQITAMVIRNCLFISLVGIVIGILVSIPVALFMGSQVHGVTPIDPVTFLGVSLYLLAVGLMAGYWPARRATRVDPITALKHE